MSAPRRRRRRKSDVNPAWSIDRKIPVATLIMLFLGMGAQTLAGIWWAAKMDARVNLIESEQTLNGISREKVSNLDAQIAAINTSLAEIKVSIKDLMWDRRDQPAHRK